MSPPLEATRVHLRRLDLAAHDVTAPFCCGGTLALPQPPTLRFTTGTSISLDFDRHGYKVIDALKRRCRKASYGEGERTRTNPKVRDGLQLNAASDGVRVVDFDPEAAGILEAVRAALCPRDPSPLRAEFYAVNLYLEDGHFARHKDTPRGTDMVGSLVVALSSPYAGGKLVISHRGATETFKWGQRGRDGSGPSTGWAAFFGDVDHEVSRVYSGERVTLTYTLHRGDDAVLDVAAPHSQTDRLCEALSQALADPAFMPEGGTLGFSCFQLYAESPGLRRGAPVLTEKNARLLKGRDQHIAAAALRLGLAARFMPYLVEYCAEERWALGEYPSSTQRMLFRRGRLTPSGIARHLDVKVNPDNESVTWVVVPRLDARNPLRDGAVADFLGEVEYSATGYFGNEGGPDEFYAHAAILVEIPRPSARQRVTPAPAPPAAAPAKRRRTSRAKAPAPATAALGKAGEMLTAAQLRAKGVTDAKRKALLASGALVSPSFGWYRVTGR